MYQYISWLVPTAKATYGDTFSSTTPTTTMSFVEYARYEFFELFWTPFGAIALFLLGITIAIMIWKRIRGVGRRPR